MTIELCPFCGNGPKVSARAASESDGGGFLCFIACFCGGYAACAHKMGQGETPEAARQAAIAAWNQRTQESPESQDARDAARYRWLRTYPNNVSIAVYGIRGGLLKRGIYLDDAIDASLPTQQPPSPTDRVERTAGTSGLSCSDGIAGTDSNQPIREK